MSATRMMKAGCLLVCLGFFSAAVRAEQTDACAGLDGSALTECRINQQTVRQQQLEQQLQAQQQRQAELDRQQREVQQQLEAMRQENASLRQQMAREAANQAASQTAANQAAIQAANQAAIQAVNQAARARTADSTAAVTRQDLRNWKAENPWFGSDYARTQYAMQYTRQLQKEQPDLTGRALLDAVSAKVNEQFAARP